MTKTLEQFARLQQSFCVRHGSDYVPTYDENIAGFAARTIGSLPLNGLRHAAKGNDSGWYLWFGQELSTEADFFHPTHIFHLYEDHPATRELLGLAPGFRFLVGENYLDVWFDEKLLDLRES